MNKAVAVVGMCGSGKSVLCGYFEQLGWEKVYFGGVTVSQLKKQGIPVNEANERAMREGLRKQYGMGAFALLLKDEILDKLSRGNIVLDGLYSWSEYVILKELLGDNLILLAVIFYFMIHGKKILFVTLNIDFFKSRIYFGVFVLNIS